MGLTQAKFAEAMGLAQATINRWESGETLIPIRGIFNGLDGLLDGRGHNDQPATREPGRSEALSSAIL